MTFLTRVAVLHSWRRASLVAAALLVTGCATTSVPLKQGVIEVAPEAPNVAVVAPKLFDNPEQVALKAWITMQNRLYRVAAPLLVNNPDLCKGNARKLLGFTAKNKYSYTPEYADAAQSSFGLNERLHIMSVLAGSGAAQVGVRPGDILLSVEDKAMPEGPNAERLAAGILGPLVNGRASVRLALSRNGGTVNPTVPLTLACAFGIELGNAENVNAYGDGKRVMLTRGMMNFAKDDNQLAYVIAREMAHNALSHATRARMSATIGGIIDNLIRIHPDLTTMGGMSGVKPFRQEVDAAADTLSLYMLARAGYDIDGAPAFWQRLASQVPATVQNGYTALHPATAYRMGVMEKILPVVKAKLASKARLSP